MPMIAARHLGKPWDLLPARIFALWRTAPTRPFVFCLALMVYLLLVFSRVAFCQSSPTASEPGSPKDSANPVLAEAKSLLWQGRGNEAGRTLRRFLALPPQSPQSPFPPRPIPFPEIQTDAAARPQPEGLTLS